jgi:hypothetical protein
MMPPLVAAAVAGFFAGAGFRGYRIAHERHDLDAGWRGGWAAVRWINVVCAVLAIYFLDAAVLRPAREDA